MEIPKTIKENKDNDLRFRKQLLTSHPEPQGKIFSNLEEVAQNIKAEEIEYITD